MTHSETIARYLEAEADKRRHHSQRSHARLLRVMASNIRAGLHEQASMTNHYVDRKN